MQLAAGAQLGATRVMHVSTKASVHSPDAATRDTASPSNAVTFLSDGVG